MSIMILIFLLACLLMTQLNVLYVYIVFCFISFVHSGCLVSYMQDCTSLVSSATISHTLLNTQTHVSA